MLQKGRNPQDKNNSIFKDPLFHDLITSTFCIRILPTFVQLLIIFTSVVSQGWNDIDSDRQAKKALEEYKKLYRSLFMKSQQLSFTEIDIDFHYFVFNSHSEGLSTINQQSSELAKAFMFWPSPDVREGPNVYDIRFADIPHIFVF